MNKIAKNTILYLIGTITIAVFGFLNTMLLTRVLTPHVYALYGLFISFASVAVMLISLGFDASYMRFYYIVNLKRRKFLFKSIYVPMFAFAIFLILLLEPKHILINKIFKESLTVYCIMFIAMYILLQVIQRFTKLSARMEEKAGNYVLSNIVDKVGSVFLIFILALSTCGIEFEYIVFIFTVTSFVALVINVPIVMAYQQGIQGNENITQKELLFYGFPTCINSTIVLLIPVIERIIIRDLAGWKVLSIYTAAAIFQTVVSIISLMIDNIWNPIVYKKYSEENFFKPLMHNFSLIIITFLILCLAGVILMRRWLVLILDKNYIDVMILAPTIFFASCLLPISSVLGVGINIQKKTIHYIISPMLQLIISVALCYMFIPKFGLLGIGLAVLVSAFISRCYRILIGLKYYPTDRYEIKCFALIIVGMIFSANSMLNTNISSDIFACIVIVMLTVCIINKEAKSLVDFTRRILRKS